MSSSSKHQYIKIINSEKKQNSVDYTICVVLDRVPVSFSSSLYNELDIPQGINKIYLHLKIIGKMLVYDKTYYFTDSGVCEIEHNRQLISDILLYLYGPNVIIF
jgi:hypothetical protein